MISKIQALAEKVVKHKVLMASVLLLASVVILLIPTIAESNLGVPGEKDYPWLNFLGSFHPLMLHLPIGVTILVFSLEILGLFTKDYKFNMTLPLMFNAVVAIMASFFGIIWAYGGDYSFVKDSKLDDHMWRGLIYASIVIWLPWVYNNIKVKIPYYITLVGSVAIMSIAAHDGGTLVHEDPFDKAPWLEKNKNKDKSRGGPTVENADPVVYHDIIVPILEQKCYACHHNDKKIKSGLSLESVEKMLEGGDEDVALVKGDASKSPMITTIELDIDDDLHMPPAKKTQVTAEELQILKWWVNAGAPETEKVSELEVPDDIRALLGAQRSAPADTGDGYGTDHGIQSANSTPGVNPKNSPLAAPIVDFLKKYPNALSWTSLSDSTLYFSAASQRASYGDSDLAALEPFVSELDELNFNGSQVSDRLSGIVDKSVKLRVLKVAGTKVTDTFVKDISDHPTLETLVLHSTAVSDAAIDDLGKMKSLKKLFIWKSKISKEGVVKLKGLLPECDIIAGM